MINSLIFGLFQLISGAKICYHYQECDLGCFTDEPPWGGTDARPNHRLPATPSEVDPVFKLDTRTELGHVVDYGDFDSILESDFDGDKHLYIIIHGYFDSGEEAWLQHFSEELLKSKMQMLFVSIGENQAGRLTILRLHQIHSLSVVHFDA